MNKENINSKLYSKIHPKNNEQSDILRNVPGRLSFNNQNTTSQNTPLASVSSSNGTNI